MIQWPEVGLMSFELHKAKLHEKDQCESILRSMPQWFGIEESIVSYVKDIRKMLTIIALREEEVVGFLALNFHNPFSAEIHVMAVLNQYHRNGIGRALVARAQEECRSKNCEYLQVKTVGPSSPDEPYRRTREFYLACEFRPLEEIKKLWDEHNPCLIMVKRL